MAYGVTPDGFVLKGVDVILSESKARTRAALGADVDLSPTSPLGKILEVVAQEDAELWKRMEALYYGQFTATADGAALELLGDEAGLARHAARRAGIVALTLTGGVPGRTYVVPEATVLLGDGDGDLARAFATTAPVELTAAAPARTVRVLAVDPGQAPVAAGTVHDVHPAHRAQYFADWPPAALVVTNPAPFDELIPEDDDAYRARIIALPRALWTVESVRQAALGVPDVLDARVSDPLGGIDVSQAYFGGFDFGGRTFSDERRVGEPYFAEVAVAHRGLRPWRTLPTPGSVTGVYELVEAAVDRVRPIGVHINIIEADHIDVAVRAEIVLAAGFDGPTVISRIRARLTADMGRLRLGDDVLYARVMCALAEQPGVDDVRRLHLRRCPPAFGRFGFGGVAYQLGTVEAAVGESLAMGPTEMAVFAADAALSSIEVVGR